MFEEETKQPTLAEIAQSYYVSEKKNMDKQPTLAEIIIDARHSSEKKNMDFELNIVEVKKAINNLLWTYLPKDITIGEAEDLAIDILGEINDLHTKYNKANS